MLFVKTTNFVSFNVSLIRYYNNIIFRDLFLTHESPVLFINTNTTCCYLICLEYNYMLIAYVYMYVSVIFDQYMSIDYIKSTNSRMFTIFVNPGLLIFSLYSLFFIKCISTLVLEVNVGNLNAFSLYYWLGFQLIRRRDSYYNTDFIHNISSTAYMLVNTKVSSKNTVRRHFL